MRKKIVVVSSGLSVPSSTRLLADRLTAATKAVLPVDVRVIEVRDLAVDIAKNLVTMFPSPALKEAIDAVIDADGLIAVTPVFTASYSGLFKSFFDVIDKEALVGMPVLMGATGGTERHSLVLDYQMRPMFAYLRAVPTTTAVYAASADWGAGTLEERIERAAAEFASLMQGRTTAPEKTTEDLVSVPFEELLRR
jgi:FMN reductase